MAGLRGDTKRRILQVNKAAIDPQVFRAPNGRLYLYFKALDNLR